MEHLIGYTEPQLNTNQKRPWQGALADSHERACFVDICMIPPCRDLGKGGDFSRTFCYNKSSQISETALGVVAPHAASDHRTKGTRRMATPNHTISIPLNKGLTAVIDAIDGDLCAFAWNLSTRKRYEYFYAQAYIHPRNQLMHCIIFERMIGRPLQKGELVDHIDRDGLNNRRSNLRLATTSQNMQNRPRQKNNSSGYKGVTFHKKRGEWRAKISVNGVTNNLGIFSSPEAAARAYDAAAREHFGEFAYLNFPDNPHSQIQPTDDPTPDFDTPAGRTHADRVVLALRYPSRADAEPIGAVTKQIAGRVYLLAVYDADVLAALLRMGWQEAGR